MQYRNELCLSSTCLKETQRELNMPQKKFYGTLMSFPYREHF